MEHNQGERDKHQKQNQCGAPNCDTGQQQQPAENLKPRQRNRDGIQHQVTFDDLVLPQKPEEIHWMRGLNQAHIHEDSAEDPPGQQSDVQGWKVKGRGRSWFRWLQIPAFALAEFDGPAVRSPFGHAGMYEQTLLRHSRLYQRQRGKLTVFAIPAGAIHHHFAGFQK